MSLTSFLTGRGPSTADAHTRTEACRAYETEQRDELARRARAYTSAVGRSAADTSVKTENAETRRAHAALREQRAVVERAADATVAAEQIERDATARERAAAEAAAWAAVETAARVRVDAAEILTDLAVKLAKARHAFQDAAADHAQKLAAVLRYPHGLDTFNEFSAQVETELGRVGATFDARRAYGLKPAAPLPDVCRELEKMTRQLREQEQSKVTA